MFAQWRFFLFMNKPAEAAVISYYSPGDYFVTNIKDSTRLLKATIVLELSTDKQEEFLTENNHIIRDIVLFTLRERTEDELRSDGIEQELREDIVSRLGEELGIDCLTTIYFNDFVIQ